VVQTQVVDAVTTDVLIVDARDYDPTTPLPNITGPAVFIVAQDRHDVRDHILERGPRTVALEPLRASTLDLAVTTAVARYRTSIYYRRQAQELRWLQDAAHALASCRSVEEVLWLVADRVQHGLGYDRIGINLIESQGASIREWLNTDSIGRRAARPGETRSLAADSPVWQMRLFRKLLREGGEFYYSADYWSETTPDQRHYLDGRISEHLVAAMRTEGRVLGWVSVDNLPSGRHLGPEEAPTLLAFAHEAAIAIDKIRAQRAAERRAREFAALTEVSLVVAAQSEPRAACSVAVEQVASRLGYKLVSAYLLEGDQLVMQAQHGYTVWFDPMPQDRGICSRTFRTATPQLVLDVHCDADYLTADSGVVAELCVPIMVGGQAVGVINVEDTKEGTLDAQALSVLELVARQVAVTIENARLREGERRRAVIAEALARATASIAFQLDTRVLQEHVLDLLAQVVPSDSAVFYRFDSGRAVPLAIAGTAARTTPEHPTFSLEADPIFSRWLSDKRQEPELVSDTRQDPRWSQLGSKCESYIASMHCYLAAPVVIDGELAGALTIAKHAPHSFDAVDVSAAAEFAERLARALRNARLYTAERDAHSRLQRLIRAHDDFVTAVSHELRTPLTAMLGFTENLMLFWDRMDDGRKRANLARVHAAGTRLTRLVRDMARITHAERSGMHAAFQYVALAPVMARAGAEIVRKYPGQVVEEATALADAWVWAREESLEQVLVHVLDNAARHSPPGMPILIEWREDEDWGVIGVRDRGAGVHPDDVPRLFHRFAKLDSVTRAGHVGTGLGLFVCKQLIGSMGGDIWYEPAEGQSRGGASFRIRLPRRQPDGTAAETTAHDGSLAEPVPPLTSMR
jgi:signal transduction histidine kinase